MARPSAHVIVDQMLAIMRLVNEIAPADPTHAGAPVSVDELARELSIKPAEVRRGISLLNVCSETLPGYFVDYDEQTDTVTPLRMDMAIDRAIGLTPREAMALLTALDAMGLDRDDPLVEALAQALPPLTRERIRGVEVQAASSGLGDVLGTLSQAVAQHRVVRLSYRGMRDVEPRSREVEPLGLSYDLEEGAWYLRAWCRTAGDWRTFRVDRVVEAQQTGEEFSSHLEQAGAQLANATSGIGGFLEGARVATLAVHDPTCVGEAAPDVWRGLRALPARDHQGRGGNDSRPEAVAQAWEALMPDERKQGAFVATIPWVEDQPWLARMIVATFGGVEAIDPPALRVQVREVARELLDALQ